MADINKLIPFIRHWEGRFVDDPRDSGGPTNKGVTLKTWKMYGYDKDLDGDIDVDDLKKISDEVDFVGILKEKFWDRWKANRIKNQSLANILVDWTWHSGKWGILIPQEILEVKQDGIVGEITLQALNSYPEQENLFSKIKIARLAYVRRICESDKDKRKFLKGWTNRVNALKFTLVTLLLFVSLSLVGCKSNRQLKTNSEVNTTSSARIDSLSHKASAEFQSSTAFSDVNATEEIITETEYFQTTVPVSEFSKVRDFEFNAVNPLNVQVNPAYVKTVTQKKTIRRKREATQVNGEKTETEKNQQTSAVQHQTSESSESKKMNNPATMNGKFSRYRTAVFLVMFTLLSVYLLYLYYLRRLR
jgi:lysozyme family protein